MSSRFGFGSVVLRQTEVSDIGLLIEFEQHPDNAPFIRLWTQGQHESGIRDTNIGHYVVCDAATGEMAGHVILVGLENTDRSLEFKRIVIVGKGKGRGRDTVCAIKRFTFETLKFHRLWLEVVAGNDRANGLYATEGFVEEGVHREALRQGDDFQSLIVMSMLAGEYTRPNGSR